MTVDPAQRLFFGRYETLFPIATGGMAEVYAARVHGEAGFQKLVALKRMKPELAEDARFVTMFLDEGRIAANISSPNVVSTLDLGRADDNSLFLVMELVTGVSLGALLGELTIRGAVIPMAIAVEIIAQAASGLHDAHEARAPTGEPLEIVHRDCSPHNVLVDVGGQVKITDFGIAKAMERQTQSQAGEMKGKLSYLSPEQARGTAVDRRCDIFILGVVAWELLSQQRLFDAGTAVEVMHKVVAMPIPRLDTLRDDVPAGIADAVEQALQRDPDERFATAGAFGNALQYILGDSRPSRAAVGAFIGAHGGPRLEEMVRQIRATSATPSSRPPPSAPAHPIPLAVKAPALPRFESQSIDPSEPSVQAAPNPAGAAISSKTALLTETVSDPLDGETIMEGPPVHMERPPDTIPTKALKGVKISLGPPPDGHALLAAPSPASAPSLAALPSLPTHRSVTFFAVMAATLIAIGAGVGAAWLLRGDPSETSAATTQERPEEPALPEAPPPEPPPPTPSAEERSEALRETGQDDLEPAQDAAPAPGHQGTRGETSTSTGPHPHPRRRRHPHGVHPTNVSGDRVPDGDRQAAFDEIPW